MITKGIATSEFWLTLATLVYNGVVLPLCANGTIPHGDQVIVIISGIASMLAAVGYSWARAFTKASASNATALQAEVAFLAKQ